MSVTTIGLDTAKSVFQIHGVNDAGKVELKRKLRRSEVIVTVATGAPGGAAEHPGKMTAWVLARG